MISFILFTMGSAVKWIFDSPNTFLNVLSFCFPKRINSQSIFFTYGSCFLTQCKNYLGWLECQKNLVKIMTLINMSVYSIIFSQESVYFSSITPNCMIFVLFVFYSCNNEICIAWNSTHVYQCLAHYFWGRQKDFCHFTFLSKILYYLIQFKCNEA